MHAYLMVDFFFFFSEEASVYIATYNSRLLQNRQVPETHCPEEIKDLWQWSLVGDGVGTRVHVD